ncbi:hypothetical protein HQ397_08180 [Aeromonas hydrophila]|uniref:hypothetical protein n=1 Tax=Aeromonas hydrophila TaxID=644 RepID=UPI001C755E2E|nr:hypothetical protein [Aeromonas hydrophila]QWL70111.1 hypothetical protein HQ397_08180 [Aeromonas hydrophila]
MINDEQRELIARIATADNIEESLDIFTLYINHLDKCKFIFASQTGTQPGFSVNLNFNAGSAIRSLFKSDRVLFLDKETLNEMKYDEAQFIIDYSISLDTQALSYLEPYINGFTNRLPNDFKDIFLFISRDNVFIDPMPYIHENYMNIEDFNSIDKIFNKLKAYEILRTLDQQALKNDSIVRSTCTEFELNKNTQDYVARMLTAMSEPAFVRELKNSFNHQYIHILKMVIIQLSKPHKPVYSKITDFLNFCHNDMSSIGLREVIIANEYFKKGQKLEFFSKIQTKKDNLLKIINGMAWDLYHIRNMELFIAIRPNKDARYYIPSFLTCDKRLIEIIDLYPLKCCAYIEGDRKPMPFFDGNIFDLISNNINEKEELYEKYFSSEKLKFREIHRNAKRNCFSELVKVLEAELCQIAKI